MLFRYDHVNFALYEKYRKQCLNLFKEEEPFYVYSILHIICYPSGLCKVSLFIMQTYSLFFDVLDTKTTIFLKSKTIDFHEIFSVQSIIWSVNFLSLIAIVFYLAPCYVRVINCRNGSLIISASLWYYWQIFVITSCVLIGFISLCFIKICFYEYYLKLTFVYYNIIFCLF